MRAQQHVAHLADHLVRLDGSRSDGKVTPQTTPDKHIANGFLDRRERARGRHDTQCASALARSAPETVAPCLDVIAPYLRGDNGLDEKGESAAVQKAAEIIHRPVVLYRDQQSASLAARCSPDLEKAALNSRGSAPTTAAVACLAALDATRSNTEAGRSSMAFGGIVPRLTETEKARGTGRISARMCGKRLGVRHWREARPTTRASPVL